MEFLEGIGQAFSGERCASIASVTCPLTPAPAGPPQRGQSCRPSGRQGVRGPVFGVGAGVASPSLAHFPLPQSRWAISDVHFGAILGIPIAFGLETRSFPK